MHIKTFFISGVFSLLILSFLGGGCHNKKDIPTPPPPVKVTVMKVDPTDQQNKREFSGTVSASETTTVSFSVAGTITELYVKEGQKVAKGQLLGKIRNGEYLNAYNIAEAELAEAQDGYDRLKKLHDANALPEVKWVEIQQKLKQAQNAAEMAKRTLEDANLHSPATGTVTRKFADIGQTVMPVEPIYEIVATNDLTIDIPVSEKEIGSFEVGESALVNLNSIGITGLEGKVSEKSIVADPLTRSFQVKVKIPNSENKILPGMIGNVVFESQNLEDSVSPSITLPAGSVLLNHDNRWFVWVVEDSVAQRRFVTAGEMTPDGISVTSGLKSGDNVIVAGMQKIGSGTHVVY